MLGPWHELSFPPASVVQEWGAVIILAIVAVAISFWIGKGFKHR
jgi:hypothetical protein